MSVWEILIVIIVAGLTAYILIDRVCRCIEASSIAKAYGQVISKGNTMINSKDFLAKFGKELK